MHRRTKATPHLFVSGVQVRYRNRREPRDGPAAHDSCQTSATDEQRRDRTRSTRSETTRRTTPGAASYATQHHVRHSIICNTALTRHGIECSAAPRATRYRMLPGRTTQLGRQNEAPSRIAMPQERVKHPGQGRDQWPNQLGIEIRNPCDRQIACLVVANEINQRLCGWQFECLVAVMPCPDKDFGAQRTNAARRVLRNEYRAEALENG